MLKAGRFSCLFLICALCALFSALIHAADEQFYEGLPTRSQNPLLQAYFIPATPITSQNDWSYAQSLYITNTYQKQETTHEISIIDTENTRMDFQATYRVAPWYFNINIPLISNQSGFLDQTIKNWHDFFHLPQGNRENIDDDQIRMLYVQNNSTPLVDIDNSESALADIQLALGRQVNDSTQIWFALEIPTSSSSELISNSGIDAALWISMQASKTHKTSTYFTLGLALPANDGVFRDAIREQFGFAQLGFIYTLTPAYQFLLQADFHSALLKGTRIQALGNSVQAQFGLRLPKILKNHTLDLFFSEDIYIESAPDITFGMRLSTSLFN